MSEVITVRVDGVLKEKLRRYGISVSKTTREALEREVRRRELEELSVAIGEMKALLKKIPDEAIVRSIRESRDER